MCWFFSEKNCVKMTKLTGINERPNENSDSDDDLNESLCEILN